MQDKKGYYEYVLKTEFITDSGINTKKNLAEDIATYAIKEAWGSLENGFTLTVEKISYAEAKKRIADRKKERAESIQSAYLEWQKREAKKKG